jgi:hypothetical protein
MMPEHPHPADWIAQEGCVTTCRFQFAGLEYMAFGGSTQKKFRITFDYYAHGKLHSDEFQSDEAIPQDTRISLSYNPHNPAQNSRGRSSS